MTRDLDKIMYTGCMYPDLTHKSIFNPEYIVPKGLTTNYNYTMSCEVSAQYKNVNFIRNGILLTI